MWSALVVSYSLTRLLPALGKATEPPKPFRWNPGNLDFGTPQRVVTLNEKPMTLNCSFEVRFERGVIGWMRCPAPPRSDRCHQTWKTYEGDSFASGIGLYDDGKAAAVSASTRRTGSGTVRVKLGLELPPSYESLGGHVCFAVPAEGENEGNSHYSAFVAVAAIETQSRFRGRVLRARFSISEAISPHVGGVTLLRVKEGPVVHFSGRLDEFRESVSSGSLRFSRRRDLDRTVFLLAVTVSDDDVGFAVEMDDGRGGLIGRTGVEAYGVRDLKAFEMTVVFLTLATALTAVTFAIPDAERPFGLWCALCAGWILRSAVG